MKKIKTPIVMAILSAVIFYLEISSILSVGEIINGYFSCEQDTTRSFPCFGIYDMYFMFLLVGIFVVSLTIIGLNLYKTRKNKGIR